MRGQMATSREPLFSRRRFLLRGAALGAAALVPLAGCQGDRAFTILGYEFGADKLYDTSIKSVYVPEFYNRAFQTTPYRGLEVEITKAVVREIGAKTPFKVISDPERADTELLGTVLTIDKWILNRNQQNEIREGDVVVRVEVVWRDLRTGRILSNQRQPIALNVPGNPDVPQFDPDLPVPPAPCDIQAPVPVQIMATGRLIPELGETNVTAEQKVVNRIAIQIVSMMEKPWQRGSCPPAMSAAPPLR